jgi:hypothetical protein
MEINSIDTYKLNRLAQRLTHRGFSLVNYELHPHRYFLLFTAPGIAEAESLKRILGKTAKVRIEDQAICFVNVIILDCLLDKVLARVPLAGKEARYVN